MDSGSGKTSLLNVLNKRNLQDLTVSGQVLVNGMSMGNDIANISGYVQQEDLFVGTLTVYEHLWFNVSTSCLNSLWVESPKIYFRVGLTFINMGFLGTKLKLIISKLYLEWGTFFKVVQKRLKRA